MAKENFQIYLSGGMSNLPMEDMKKWRKEIIKKFTSKAYECLKELVFFDPVDFYNFEIKKYDSDREVFEFDLYNLKHSDLVVVYFNDMFSIGSAMEIIVAKERGIPVIGIFPNLYVEESIHPWLKECCTKTFSDFNEAVEYISEFYLRFR